MLTRNDLDEKQRECIGFINAGEDSLIAADVGTGKTVIAMTAAMDAVNAGEVGRWLVLAPLLVAVDTWAKEAGNWSHLDKDAVAIACGTPAQRAKALNQQTPIVVTNYENLPWLLDEYPRKRSKDALPFDGLICDEIDKLKSVSGKRYKAFRNRINKFSKRVGLTGTLLPTRLEDAWGQAYLIDGGQSFGRSFYAWRKKFFYPTDYQQHSWAPFEDTRQNMLDALSDLAFRLEAQGLPGVEFCEPAMWPLPEETAALYKQLKADFTLSIDGLDITAPNSATLVGKLQQMTSGFNYADETKEVIWHHKRRFEWLSDIWQSVGTEQLLIVYHFQAELEELKRRFPALRHIGHKVSPAKARETISLWNAGEIDTMAIHAQAAGHGLNLQKSGAHHIAFLTWPWSGGMVAQVTGRLARRGNAAPTIYAHGQLFEGTVDEHAYDTAHGRLDSMDSFLKELRK